jgi:hypothetical protein
MGTLHEIITEKGKQKALQLDFAREVVDAASSYMSEAGRSKGTDSVSSSSQA